MTTIAIHQPNYLPWIGYFHKIFKSDIFVFLDDVKYTNRDFINRNKIKTPNGWMWLTVPVRSSSKLKINQVRIDNSKKWRRKHWRSIKTSYGKSKFFSDFEEEFKKVYEKNWKNLSNLNITLIKKICKILGFKIKFIKSSKLNTKEKKDKRILEICKKLQADEYFSGGGAKDYLEKDFFYENNIKLTFQDFEYPEYEQRFDGFVPKLSFIDVLFNLGKKQSYNLIKNL